MKDLIRPLTQQNFDELLAYLERSHLDNVYLIHSLQTLGLESQAARFWGAFEDHRLVGVLLDKHAGISPFASLAGDSPRILAELGKLALDSRLKLIGRDKNVAPAIKHLPSRIRVHRMYLDFYEIQPEELEPRYDHPVQAATEEDIGLLTDLYQKYEFYNGSLPRQSIACEIGRVIQEGGVYFFVEREGQAVSAARVAAQTQRAGIIDVATTLPEFRGRGMYPCVRTACFEYLFEQGKLGLGLVRNTNTSMQRIVSLYGGKFTARWLIAQFREKPPLRRRILPPLLRRWGRGVRDKILRK